VSPVICCEILANIFLTFDCEDFINDRSILALRSVLKLLDKYSLKGLFFITGLMAEKLAYYPDITDLLENHVIGFHSSGHSIRPTLVEYADIENFEQARHITLKREISHINPVTGKSEGRGGLFAVKDLFPSKRIEAFRAPGFCWSPPIIEAMRDLGLKYDFSTNLSYSISSYKQTIFYPLPINEVVPNISPNSLFSMFKILANSFPINSQAIVLYTHPNYFVNSVYWDSVYYHGNPSQQKTVPSRNESEVLGMLRKWELIIKQISYFQKSRILEVTPKFNNGGQIDFSRDNIINEYARSIKWLTSRFNYKPRFVLSHYMKFFS
jgi:hypothetical protein